MATKQVQKEKNIVPDQLGCTTPTKDSIIQVRNLRKHYEELILTQLGSLNYE